MPTANQIQHEVDVLEVMRRLRHVLSDLDNSSFLANKIKSLNDSRLNDLIDAATTKILVATESLNQVIKCAESNGTYKDLVKRYRNPPSQSTGDDGVNI